MSEYSRIIIGVIIALVVSVVGGLGLYDMLRHDPVSPVGPVQAVRTTVVEPPSADAALELFRAENEAFKAKQNAILAAKAAYAEEQDKNDKKKIRGDIEKLRKECGDLVEHYNARADLMNLRSTRLTYDRLDPKRCK